MSDISNGGYYAIYCGLFGVGTVTLGLRLYCRRFMTIRRFEMDDYLIIAAWFLEVVITVMLCELTSHGLGDFVDASYNDILFMLKIFFCIPFLHNTYLWLVKFSILAFYNRIFSQPKLKRWIMFAAIFLLITLIGCWFTQIFYCRPISVNFDPALFQLVCGAASQAANIVYCCLSVTTDAAVMAIPLWTLPKLRISLSKKLVLSSLFALASFAMVASIIRCVISVTDNQSLTKVNIWATVEETVAMIVANGPILRPLFFRGKNFESTGSTHAVTQRTGVYTTTHGTLHDAYELTPDTKGNTVSVVTAGEVAANNSQGGFGGPFAGGRRAFGEKKARAAAPSTADTFGVLRTVEVMVHSEDVTKNGHKKDEDGSSSNSSLWMP